MPNRTKALPGSRYYQWPDLRDWFLITMGLLSLLFAYAYGVAKVPPNTKTNLSTALEVLPLKVYALMWLATGLYCILAAVTAHRIGGFVVSMFAYTLWGMIYLIGWLHGDPGRGWLSAGVFGTLAGAIYCVSGLVDPSPIVSRDV